MGSKELAKCTCETKKRHACGEEPFLELLVDGVLQRTHYQVMTDMVKEVAM